MNKNIVNKKKNSGSLDTDITEYNECPYKKWNVLLGLEVYSAINKLLDEYSSLEWLIYVYGEVDNNNRIIKLNKFYIPEQEVTGSTVDVNWDNQNIPLELDNMKLLGSIHSHNKMGVFHSGTDNEYHNFPLMMVVNNKREFDISFRFKAPCGIFMLTKDLDIKVDYPEVNIDKEKIKEKKYQYEFPYSANQTISWQFSSKKKKSNEYDYSGAYWDDDDFYEDSIIELLGTLSKDELKNIHKLFDENELQHSRKCEELYEIFISTTGFYTTMAKFYRLLINVLRGMWDEEEDYTKL